MSADELPVYPESFGAVLHAILHGPDAPGTHTFRLPETEYDEDGEPLPPRVQPTLTVYQVGDGA